MTTRATRTERYVRAADVRAGDVIRHPWATDGAVLAVTIGATVVLGSATDVELETVDVDTGRAVRVVAHGDRRIRTVDGETVVSAGAVPMVCTRCEALVRRPIPDDPGCELPCPTGRCGGRLTSAWPCEACGTVPAMADAHGWYCRACRIADGQQLADGETGRAAGGGRTSAGA